MKNLAKKLGLMALIALSTGCNKEQENRIIRNPAIESIYNDGTFAVYENFRDGVSRPDAFIYAKDLNFCQHLGKTTPYPAAGRTEIPYLELKGDGKATLHLKYNQALVVSEIFEDTH